MKHVYICEEKCPWIFARYRNGVSSNMFCTDFRFVSGKKWTDTKTLRKTSGIKRIDYENKIKQDAAVGNCGCPAADRM